VVGVGLISFSLYLWHWPLLSFARIISGTTPDWPLRLALVMSSFVLAFLSTHFLERPIRFGRKTKSKVTLLVIAMIIMGGVGLVTFLKGGFVGRISNQEVKAQLADLNFDIPDRNYICIVFVINPDNFISTEDVKLLLNNFSKFSNLYFCISLNKFLIYSKNNLEFKSNFLDFDEKLIEYFSNISNFTLVYSKSRSDDMGNLGNFIYPVTQMIFKKNE
jgi:hypothetical protein